MEENKQGIIDKLSNMYDKKLDNIEDTVENIADKLWVEIDKIKNELNEIKLSQLQNKNEEDKRLSECREQSYKHWASKLEELSKFQLDSCKEITKEINDLEKEVYLFKRVFSIIGAILVFAVPIIVNIIIKIIWK